MGMWNGIWLEHCVTRQNSYALCDTINWILKQIALLADRTEPCLVWLIDWFLQIKQFENFWFWHPNMAVKYQYNIQKQPCLYNIQPSIIITTSNITEKAPCCVWDVVVWQSDVGPAGAGGPGRLYVRGVHQFAPLLWLPIPDRHCYPIHIQPAIPTGHHLQPKPFQVCTKQIFQLLIVMILHHVSLIIKEWVSVILSQIHYRFVKGWCFGTNFSNNFWALISEKLVLTDTQKIANYYIYCNMTNRVVPCITFFQYTEMKVMVVLIKGKSQKSLCSQK